jgi:RNA polymerase sigma factor (sigma-70 family)
MGARRTDTRGTIEPGLPQAAGVATGTEVAQPAKPLSREQAAQLFLEHHAMIQRVLATVARRRRLSRHGADEFAAFAQLGIIANDYEVLRKFRYRSSLRTFLAVVIHRMYLDYRNAQWGKWRPSTVARRHGELAILLERLTIRDRLTFGEACEVLKTNYRRSFDPDALLRIYNLLPRRSLPRFVSLTGLAVVQPASVAPDQELLAAESSAARSRALTLLANAMRAIAPADRLLLQLRFSTGMRVVAVARLLRMNQKALYRRYEQLLARLRRQLESDGISGDELVRWLDEARHHPTTILMDVRSQGRAHQAARPRWSETN